MSDSIAEQFAKLAQLDPQLEDSVDQMGVWALKNRTTLAAGLAALAEVERLREDCEQLNFLFDTQHKRMSEATLRWRKAHPGKELTSPDLGSLLTWLMSEIDGYATSLAMSMADDLATPAYAIGAAEMREMCKEAVSSSAWKHEGDDAYSQGMDRGAREQVQASYDAIVALGTPSSEEMVETVAKQLFEFARQGFSTREKAKNWADWGEITQRFYRSKARIALGIAQEDGK